MRHNIFPDILNKGVYRILFTLTQNAYLYTPVSSYALHIPFLSVFHPRGIVSNYMTIAIITFCVSSKRLRLKSKGLSDARAVSIIEKVYYFAVDFV